MLRTVLISFIAHVLVFFLLIGFTIFKPRYTTISRTPITCVRFVRLPPRLKKIQAKPPKRQVHRPQPSKPKRKVSPRPKKTIVKKVPPKHKPNPQKEMPKTIHKTRPVRQPPHTPVPPGRRVATARRVPKVRATPVAKKGPLRMTHKDLPDYYLIMATTKIESNFALTASRRHKGVRCSVEFRVNRAGEIFGIRVIESTGSPDLDRCAVEAIEQTATLGPLPDSVRSASLTITANFDYSPE